MITEEGRGKNIHLSCSTTPLVRASKRWNLILGGLSSSLTCGCWFRSLAPSSYESCHDHRSCITLPSDNSCSFNDLWWVSIEKNSVSWVRSIFVNNGLCCPVRTGPSIVKYSFFKVSQKFHPYLSCSSQDICRFWVYSCFSAHILVELLGQILLLNSGLIIENV